MNRRLNSQLGLTLPEVLIIVVIIGLLAAIAIPNFIAMQNRGHEGKTKTNMFNVLLAIEDYYSHHDGTYPSTYDEVRSFVPTLQNPWTRRPPEIEFVQGSSNDEEERAPGTIVVFRPDSISYFVRGVGRDGFFMMKTFSDRDKEL